MVDITPLVPEGRKIIKSYGEGRFDISGERHEGSVIILPERVIPWAITEIQSLSLALVADIIAHKEQIEVLLMGVGAQAAFPPEEVLKEIKKQRIIVEIMDSGAACRTYNVLLAEGRQVAAAIIAV